MVSTPVSEQFMLCFVKLLTAIFTSEVLSVLYPLTPLFSSVLLFHVNPLPQLPGVYLPPAVITEERRSGTQLRNPPWAAAGPRNCSLFLALAGLMLWSETHCLTFHALKGVFQVLSSSVCSLLIWILCMIFISMKSSLFFLCQWFIFPFVLWFSGLTWLARRENNGGVLLEKL